MIFQETIDSAVARLKTKTRRLWQPDYVLEKTEDGGTAVISDILARRRTVWQTGRTYAAQPGRGQKAVGRILVTDIKRERLQDMTEDDAKAEGFDSLAEFKDAWNKIHLRDKGCRWLDNPEVAVITFRLVSEEGSAA